MRIPARAAGPLIALTIAAASFGCVAPAAYAGDATATVASDGGNHIVVDINLHDDADGSGSGSKADSPSTDEGDSKAAGEAEEAKEDESKGKRERTWEDIPGPQLWAVFAFAVMAAIIGGIIGVLAGDIMLSLLFGSIGFMAVFFLGETICGLYL